jgi:hypothetical protein
MKSDTEMIKKAKATVYMNQEEEDLLNDLFIKRIKERRKTDKSAILCEGIRLLHEKEVGVSSGQK